VPFEPCSEHPTKCPLPHFGAGLVPFLFSADAGRRRP